MDCRSGSGSGVDHVAHANRLPIRADAEPIAQQSDNRVPPLGERACLEQLFLGLDAKVVRDVEDVCDKGQVNHTWLQPHVDECKRDGMRVRRRRQSQRERRKHASRVPVNDHGSTQRSILRGGESGPDAAGPAIQSP